MATASRKHEARPLPPDARVYAALTRLARERALQTLVRGALPFAVLRRLLKEALPGRLAREIPEESWSALAAGIAVETDVFGIPLAQALHDRLGWDREPATAEEWERVGAERPLEALWMAALSETKAVRKEFPRRAAEWLAAFRASPFCRPPSWEFVEGILDVHAQALREEQAMLRAMEDTERRLEAERERSDDLRDELKRLRRETSELRAERAQLERKTAAPAPRTWSGAAEAGRLEEMERRLRKAEKEGEHLRRELERARALPHEDVPDDAAAGTAGDAFEPPLYVAPAPKEPIPDDGNPRRRVLRQMLRKLFKKGKIGASHTHEDNVYRGVADHEKGIAKELMDLLHREGLLMPKPTATDPHVSLNPERLPEIRAILAGELSSPRLRRYVSEAE
jgi:hypothetical protein